MGKKLLNLNKEIVARLNSKEMIVFKGGDTTPKPTNLLSGCDTCWDPMSHCFSECLATCDDTCFCTNESWCC